MKQVETLWAKSAHCECHRPLDTGGLFKLSATKPFTGGENRQSPAKKESPAVIKFRFACRQE